MGGTQDSLSRASTEDFMKIPEPDHLGKSSTDVPGPSHEEIAQQAYKLWEERGKPDGSDQEDWHRAEDKLRNQSAAPRDTPAASRIRLNRPTDASNNKRRLVAI
jgi:hypothetical protein